MNGVAFLAGLVASQSAQAVVPDFAFVDVSAESGLSSHDAAFGQGHGVAAADYDNDGYVDLFLPTGPGAPNRLYRNDAAGGFEERAAQAGVASPVSSRAALFIDADGDHDHDLVVARDAFFVHTVLPANTLEFFLQDNGQFAEATALAGLDGDLLSGPTTHIGGLCASDIDRDGYVDLYMTQWQGVSRLFANRGDGSFDDISVSSGVGAGLGTRWQPLAHDFDRDGWPDLFAAVDFFENELWLNRRDRTFVEAAEPAGLNQTWNEMGATLGDVDNDGDLDLYVTNVYEKEFGEQQHNALYLDETPGGGLPHGQADTTFASVIEPSPIPPPIFTEVAQSAGVEQGHWGWGTTFLDANLDGWLDLAATNGSDGEFANDPSRFFLNQGVSPPAFADVSGRVDFDDRFIAGALVAFDYDRDGRVDLAQTCRIDRPVGPSDRLRLLANQSVRPSDGQWLLVRPRMPGTNHFAIGAEVRVIADASSQMRLVSAGTSFLGQEPAEAPFGWLAGKPAPVRVEIDWPSGGTTVLEGVAPNQVLTVEP